MPLARFGVKLCTACRYKRPVAKFSRNKRKFDGLSPVCKDCSSARNKATYKARKSAYNAKRRHDRAYCRKLEADIQRLKNALSTLTISAVFR